MRRRSIGRSKLFKKQRTTPSWSVLGVAVLLAVGVAVRLAEGCGSSAGCGCGSAVVKGWMLHSLQSSSKKKREVERCTTIIQGLKAELAAQETNQRLVLARLEGEKEGWFSTGGGRGHREGRGLRKAPPMV